MRLASVLMLLAWPPGLPRCLRVLPAAAAAGVCAALGSLTGNAALAAAQTRRLLQKPSMRPTAAASAASAARPAVAQRLMQAPLPARRRARRQYRHYTGCPHHFYHGCARDAASYEAANFATTDWYMSGGEADAWLVAAQPTIML
jgi:hypothetical protein